MRKKIIYWNIFWLCGALIFVAFFMTWKYNKNLITDIHNNALADYVGPNQIKSDNALEQLKTGKADAARKLLEDWEEFVKGDRIYPLKRKLLLVLAEELYKQKRFDEMLHWCEIWHAIDPRDVTATAYWLEALRHSKDRWQEGLDGLARERKRFPGNRKLIGFHTPVVQLNDTFIKSVPRYWQIFWDTGGHFNAKDSASLLMTHFKENEWHGNIKLPPKVKLLRIDPPSKSKMRLSKIRLDVNGNNFPISMSAMKFQMLVPGKDWVDADGQFDPFFYFDVKKYFGEKPVNIKFKVAISQINSGAQKDK